MRRRLFLLLLFLAILLFPWNANAQLIQSVASGLANPYGVAVDHNGNVYIADTYAEQILVLNTQSTAITVASVTIQPHQIAAVAGNGTAGYWGDGGPALSADLYNPTGLAVDSNGNIYIADLYNERVRVVNAGPGLLTVAGVTIPPGYINTIAGNGNSTYSGDGGPAINAGMYAYDVALDSAGNIYIADAANERIRLVNTGTSAITVAGVAVQPGQIQTVAGNGVVGSVGDGGAATSAELDSPYSVAVDKTGNIYICDSYNREMRVVNAGTSPITVATVTIAPGQIKTVAGNGNYGYRGDGQPALTAEFADPDGIQVDSAGNIYVSDTENERLRFVSNQTGVISTLTGMNVYGYNGDGIPAATAWIAYARTIAVDGSGNIYFADEPNDRIREIAVNPGAPVITSRNSTAFTVGVPGTFTVTTGDLPKSKLSEVGALPNGVTFKDNGDGTGTLSGTVTSTSGSPYAITFVATNGVNPSASQNFTLTIYVPGGGPSASFITQDGSTEGQWLGKYGADGYSVANVTPQVIPAYATFSVQTQVDYTWETNPSDARALQLPGGSGSIAAAWYSNSSFYMDLNMGASAHQFALYAVDWDEQGRSETIQVLDANTGAVLDTRSLYGFFYGTYLVWNISGHVQIVVTPTTVTNAVVSGVFFGGSGVSSAPILSVTSTHGAFFKDGQQNAAYTLMVSNLANGTPTSGTVTVTENTPSGLTLVSMSGTGWSCAGNSCTRSDTLAGGASYPAITVLVNVGAEATSPQVNQVTVSGGGAASETASDSTIINGAGAAAFVGADTTTQGNWMQKYGVDGYVLANAGQSLPSYDATFAIGGESHWTWANDPTDVRALQTDSSGNRIAAAFYATGTFSMDVNIPPGQTHEIALYGIDWDNQGRSESIQIVDASSGAVLDTRNLPNANTSTTAANFTGGTYLVWNISGHVTINVTLTGGPNAVISSVFFGGQSSSIAAANGTPQSVAISSAFAPLTATVTSGGNPVPGIAVTFTAPSSGPSGTFAGGSAGATVVTDGNGVATAPTFTANATAGGPYNVTATVSGGLAAANFVLTNLSVVGPPASVAASAGTPQSAALNQAFATSLQVTVQDSQGHPVANASVTFTAPASGASGTFAGGGTTATVNTNSQGVATAPAFMANGTAGGPYTVSATVSGVAGQANFLLTNSATTGCASACASLTARDTTTTGSTWNQTYGADGYALANSVQSLPAYDPTFAPSGDAGYTWTANTSDPRGMLIPGTSTYIGSTWYNPTSFTLDVNVGSSAHPVALYAVDWDFRGRAETIQIQDAGSGATLDTETVANFTSGVFLAWNITGHVKIVVTATAGPNAVVSGVFFGGPAEAVTATATALPQDSATQGDWPSKYGANGYVLANVTVQSLPSFVSFAVQNQRNYTWAGATNDPRALLIPGGSGGIAATWYNTGTFNFDVNAGAGPHSIALYVVDWDQQGRTETVQITDALSGAVLSTQTVSNFTGGIYLVWNITGHVNIAVTCKSGPNAVVSGVFFQ